MSPDGAARAPATWRGWTATLAVLVLVPGAALAAALLRGGPGALPGTAAALGLSVAVVLLAVPLVGIMRLAPRVSLALALWTYALVVLLGVLLLQAASPGGALADAVDTRWLGGTLLVLTLSTTAAVVVDQLRVARADLASRAAATETSPTTPRPGQD